LVKSGNLDQLKGSSLALQHSPRAFPKAMHAKLDAAYVKAFMEIDKALDREASQLKTAVWQLLNDLHKFYSKWLSILSSNGGSDTHTN
jgi:hypothetical protein